VLQAADKKVVRTPGTLEEDPHSLPRPRPGDPSHVEPIRGSAMSTTHPARPVRTATGGRHRVVRPGTPWSTLLDITGRLGSLVALTAVLVVAGAVGGLFDSAPPHDAATPAGSVAVDGPGR
jgi:hypothetical protein